MNVINIKTNKFDYTLTFKFSFMNITMSMTSTDKNPHLNFEDKKISSVGEAIDRFKFLLKVRNEEIISGNYNTVTE